LQNLNESKPNVLVIGLGYVGIPLMAALLESDKFSVSGFDISPEVIDSLSQNSGEFKGVNLKKLNSLGPKFFSDTSKLMNYDIFVICVPTPLLDGGPDLSMICEAGMLIAKIIKKRSLVILESTSYPGTTEDILLPIIEKSKLKAGSDFFLAFGSERIDPGNANFGIKNTPKVIGGIDEISTRKAVDFYSNFIDEVIAAKGTREAELSKLLENTYRIVNIALVNELAMVCHELGIDIWDTIRCASSKPFGFHTFYPGPGVGGHCIPIDPIYLSKYVFENLNKNFELINLSQKINSNMPFYVVSRAKSLLKQSNKEIEDSKILIVGASYKSDISDTRESPILGVIKYLMENKGNFVIYDSHAFDLKVDSKIFKIEKELPQNLAEFDLILVLQHHFDLDVKKIVSSGVTILDTRGKIKEAQKL
jgi:UDP-N-acetyl-D-glucosamine dehydrogenase